MLTFTAQQFGSMKQAALAGYRQELLAHCQAFAPNLHLVAGELAFRRAVDRASDRAMALGLQQRGPMRLYVELALLLGHEFAQDPQYAPLWPPGDPAEIPMPFAQRLHANFRELLAETAAPGEHPAAGTWRHLASMQFESHAPLENWARALPAALCPARAARMGDAGQQALLQACDAQADQAGLHSPAGRALMTLLGLCLGVGAVNDPLHPWIAQQLRGDAPEAQRVAATWQALRSHAAALLADASRDA